VYEFQTRLQAAITTDHHFVVPDPFSIYLETYQTGVLQMRPAPAGAQRRSHAKIRITSARRDYRPGDGGVFLRPGDAGAGLFPGGGRPLLLVGQPFIELLIEEALLRLEQQKVEQFESLQKSKQRLRFIHPDEFK